MSGFADALRAVGMSDTESRRKTHLFERCAGALTALDAGGGPTTRLAFFVPGRIEVLGKHTDYAGGRSLLCAMERGFTVLAVPRADTRIRVVDARRGEHREFTLDPALDTTRGDWSNYVATVVRSVARHFPSAHRGADIAFASDLPPASGMSSSSAMVIAIFLVLQTVNDLTHDEVYRAIITSQEALGNYLGAVENGRSYGSLAGDRGVGTLGGSQDQTAILCCRAGVLSRYSFCPVRAEGEILFPVERTFVVAYSGVAASKTSNALHQYNEASLAVSEILGIWNAATARSDACLADAIGSAADAGIRIHALLRASRSQDFTPRRLQDRLEQLLVESYDIIPHAATAFAQDDMVRLGALVARSQRGAETLLGNQIPETIALTRLASENGADAASAFGAGFGGSVWALVSAERAETFASAWRQAYRREFPEAEAHSEFFVTAPGPGAVQLNDT